MIYHLSKSVKVTTDEPPPPPPQRFDSLGAMTSPGTKAKSKLSQILEKICNAFLGYGVLDVIFQKLLAGGT